jgi:hypothetical protein
MTPFFVAGSILATMSIPMLVRAMTLRRVSDSMKRREITPLKVMPSAFRTGCGQGGQESVGEQNSIQTIAD